jgi:hypothetical protein
MAILELGRIPGSTLDEVVGCRIDSGGDRSCPKPSFNLNSQSRSLVWRKSELGAASKRARGPFKPFEATQGGDDKAGRRSFIPRDEPASPISYRCDIANTAESNNRDCDKLRACLRMFVATRRVVIQARDVDPREPWPDGRDCPQHQALPV